MLAQIIARLPSWKGWFGKKQNQLPLPSGRLTLWQLAQLPPASLPKAVSESAAALKYLDLLGKLDWQNFPERAQDRAWSGPKPAAHAPMAAAFLIKVDNGHKSMAKLRAYLVEQPILTWVLGFPLKPSTAFAWGFDVDASLPTHRHMSRLLRELPRSQADFLLRSTVQLLKRELPAELNFGDEVSGDTKHIIAWVRQNNPKEHFRGKRFDPAQQPKGDKDCKVGFKATGNQTKSKSSQTPSEPDAPPSTPTGEGLPASQVRPGSGRDDGNYYWGYGSGAVTSKVADWGEFVLAELTQTFDHSDPSYFQPLLAQTEVNLGKKPKRGAFDAIFDTFYVHEYFAPTPAEPDRFAAVPWADRADHHKTFSPDGLPLCAAGLAMPLKGRVQKKSHCLVPHEVGRYVCPLLFPEKTGTVCPIDHKNWQRTGNEQGCITTLPTSVGNRMRHQLDRNSDEYKQLYKQRTASERINSQALDLGIERPKLRNQHSIANQNTLIYVLINLRGLQRLTARKAKTASATKLAQLKE